MNYIWDVLLKADKENIHRNEIKFLPAKICSPYIEILFYDINTTNIPEDKIIEVNQYYRFQEIFKELFNLNLIESSDLREVLFDILLHYLGEIDLKSGLCKEEFYNKFLLTDILNNVFGEELSNNIKFFEKDETSVLLSGLVSLYSIGVSLKLFNNILRRIFTKNIIYINKDKPKDIYIYLDEIKTKRLENKIEAIVNTFLPINMDVFIFWNKHFGIIGDISTMKIDEIIMIE